MLPQIKLIQAVDRVFPELSGQQKYGSSKKKKKKKKEERKGSEKSSGPEALALEGGDPGSVRVCRAPHLSTPEKLHSWLLQTSGSLEDLNDGYMLSSTCHRSQNQGQRDTLRYLQCQRGSIRTRILGIPS